MEPSHWISLFSICLLGAMSPGPSLAVVLNSTLGGGQRAGYLTALAHGVGVGLYGLLTVTGLAVLITRSPTVFLIIQVLRQPEGSLVQGGNPLANHHSL